MCSPGFTPHNGHGLKTSKWRSLWARTRHHLLPGPGDAIVTVCDIESRDAADNIICELLTYADKVAPDDIDIPRRRRGYSLPLPEKDLHHIRCEGLATCDIDDGPQDWATEVLNRGYRATSSDGGNPGCQCTGSQSHGDVAHFSQRELTGIEPGTVQAGIEFTNALRAKLENHHICNEERFRDKQDNENAYNEEPLSPMSTMVGSGSNSFVESECCTETGGRAQTLSGLSQEELDELCVISEEEESIAVTQTDVGSGYSLRRSFSAHF